MFVYGKVGRKAPYSVKVLTQLELQLTLLTNNKNLNSIFIKNLSFFMFLDATHE